MSELQGLVAIVTGGSSGIDDAIVGRLQALGAEVAVLDRHPTRSARGAFPAVCDVSDDGSVRAAVGSVLTQFGRLDMLVNNAGIGAQGTVADNGDGE